MSVRFRIEISARRGTIAWVDLHGAARGVAYGLLRSQDPALAETLHDAGWMGSSLRPLGLSCPQFRKASGGHGRYATSPVGSIWFGSPIPQIATSLLAGVSSRKEIMWGATPLRIEGVHVENADSWTQSRSSREMSETASPSDATAGVEAEPRPAVDRAVALVEAGREVALVSATPVLVKYDSRFIGPDHPEYAARILHNLRHKADLLGLAGPERVRVIRGGRLRQFSLAKGTAFGAHVTVGVTAPTEFVTAIRDWGLGLSTVQGFGWIR
ncbi:CRISPR-associated endoribonuclease Cas6 [Embleya sp. NBC_00896]|uniref:CRISPR-associated endoribonuclease Cas6 n=1 Tax=Embleya sp. NBC_00896 TaxID=2975961 RepID=UPI002F912FA1|nr:CRISPR-associated endoribonuclease Cas6 [Embleya sp. NBC_00896]